MTKLADVPDLSIVVPTRHERDSIPMLMHRLDRHLRREGLRWEAVMVDDSDDDTPAVAAGLARFGYPCRLIHRPAGMRTAGLAGAVVLGFANARADVVVVMDVDLQHPPEVVTDLAGPLLADELDVTVASRYLDGRQVDGLDGPLRGVVSWASRRVSRAILPRARDTTDPCSGFFGVRREVLDGVNLRPDGFKILLEVLVRGRGTRVRDVPYTFAPRAAGTSKATLQEGLRFGRHLTRLVAADRGGLTGRRDLADAG